ncbi:hypothetical protein SAY87_017858 [Trapa incisa]|uniref:Uncharacterized protein n=1 Tax=Trapa incisa TaxID=236973 RepID=A0AAN7L2D3_9MYRT|nr:hypothetical protein SAY87_017858 [Trapa incisa]
MNPLTLVKRTQKINSTEASLGISEGASWHAKYKDSAYIFVGGISFDLTEGDLLTVFAQYGEIVDVNLVRDKGTGKSRGFAFLAYEDQRSTTLAVDNLNGATVAGRIIRVDHVSNYKKKEEEDEEEARKKREERGVCRAFQRGECTRGAGCKFSHDEQRAANTGWGADDQKGRWGHDKFDGPPRSDRKSTKYTQARAPESTERASRGKEMMRDDRGKRRSRGQDNDELETSDDGRQDKRFRSGDGDHFKPSSKDYDKREGSTVRRYDHQHSTPKSRGLDDRRKDKRLGWSSDDPEPTRKRSSNKIEEKQSHRHESESYARKDEKGRGESGPTHGRSRQDFKREYDR